MAIDKHLPVAAISSNEKLEGESSLFRRYQQLATVLSERGLNAIALYGKNDLADGETQIFNRYFRFAPEGLVAQTSRIYVDAARDLTGGIARYTDVAALNPKGIRDVTSSKKAQHEVLQASGIDRVPTSYFVDPKDDGAIAEALAAIHGSRAVLKPEKAQRSHNVMVGDKEELNGRLSEYRVNQRQSDGLLVVQEHIPLHGPFDSALRYELGEEAKISDASVKELRVHVIDEQPVFFHGTVSLPGREDQAGDNDFVYFDQDYWLDDVYDASVEVARSLRSHTGDQDSYVVVDFSPDGSKIVEVNGKNPYAIRPESEASMPTHEAWVSALSSKLATMAEREFALRGDK